MRMRISITPLVLLGLAALALPHVVHAAIPLLDSTFHIIPQTTSNCPLGWNGVMETIQNIMNAAITLGIFITVLTIGYAGILWVISPFSPESRQKGRTAIISAFTGLALVLAAWLIVSAFMGVLYNSVPFGGQSWNSILQASGSDQCLPEIPYTSPIAGNDSSLTALVNGGGTGAQCATYNANCSPVALQTVGFNETAANVMSCIAVTENSGSATGCNGNACGTFQIMLTANSLSGSACAKYNNGNSTLSCPSLCKGANGAAVKSEASCQPCVSAANDAMCNAQSALALYNKSGYTPWTSSSDNTKSGTCVSKYGGS